MEARLVLQSDELEEAQQLFREWRGRGGELPESLRRELAELEAAPDLVAEVRRLGGFVCEVVLTPRVRALVGNLRARGRAPGILG